MYYDRRSGQFISPDTLVPDAGLLVDYNRFMYARGNPMRFSDPSGFYSNDEIMQHFGCSDWSCVEAMFADDGAYAGLWGWLYILQQAEDGDEVTAWLNACAGSGCSPQGAIGGIFSKASSGSIDILYSSGILDGNLQSGQHVPDGVFAYFASGRPGYLGYDGFYSLTRNGRNLTGTSAHSKHNYLHAPGLALAVVKAGVDFGPMMIEAAPTTGPAAPVVAIAGVVYTAAGATTVLVVDIVGGIVSAFRGDSDPIWKTVATEGVSQGVAQLGRVGAKVSPYVGPAYELYTVWSNSCYGTGCSR